MSSAPGSPLGSGGGLGGAKPPKDDPASVLPSLARTVIAKWILDADTDEKRERLALGIACVVRRTSSEFLQELHTATAFELLGRGPGEL